MPLLVKKIKELREGLNLTQAEAAKLAKMKSRQAWNNIENGNPKKKTITLDSLERIAKALRVKVQDLIA